MKSHVSQRIARLARSLWRRPTRRAAAWQTFRPALECLEGRTVPSTLSMVQPTPGAVSARSAVSSAAVFQAADVPQRVDYLDVFTTSFINVPQSVTIASLKVQLNITYPLDNDLTIDLIAPNGTDVPLSNFEGTGANFQNTTFDDGAATPIWDGNSPFAGSYHPEGSLAALAGTNAQGTWQLQVVDWGASSGTLNSWSLIVQPAGSPATASRLVVGGFPSSTTAGTPGSFTVTAQDANGNVATNFTGTVHFTSSDPQAALPADYTFTPADAGRHTFTTTLTTAGAQSLTATDTAASGLSGTESSIAVSPAAASRLIVSGPSETTADAAFNVTVTAQDVYGNTATGYAGTIHFTSTDGQAVLPGNATLPNGTGTFSVTLKTAGSQSLTATDTVAALNGNTTVSVSPASSGALVFHPADLPQALDPSYITFSYIYVPQSVTIGSVKVQLNITFPVDNELTITLYPPPNVPIRPHWLLSNFEGTGANFRDTTFDDAAATPISAGTSPFAGSYRPESPLSTLAGANAYGWWILEVTNYGPGSGTLNSWSVIIRPAGSANAMAPQSGTLRLATAASPSLTPTDALTPTFPTAGNPLIAGQTFVLTTQPAAVAPKVAGPQPVMVPEDTGRGTPSQVHLRAGGRHEPATAHDLNGSGGPGELVNGIDGDMMM
jgi:subtilisin-like proprotein convertase family protein